MSQPLARPPQIRAKKPLSAAWFIAAGVLFAAASIIQSLRQGQLAAPATYDDIDYFVDAGRRLLGFYDLGFPALVQGYLVDPPHAPTSIAVSFIGFLLFGLNEWAPALVNTVWVVALLLIVRRWFAGLPAWVTATVVIAVLAWPILGFLVIEGRPDVVNAFLLAFGCIALVERPWVGAGRGRLLAIALVFAAALLTKPSVFPITIALYGFSLVLATGLDYLDESRTLTLGRMLGRNAAALAITLVVVLPHYVLAVGREIQYIIVTTFTREKDLWAVKLPPYEQFTFYLWGGLGGHRTMGVWFFITLALVVAAVVGLVIRRSDAKLRRVAAMALIFAASYAVVSIPAHKSIFLGVQVTAFCLVFFLLATRSLFTAALGGKPWQTACAAVMSVALIGTAGLNFQWHWFNKKGEQRVASVDVLAKRYALIDAVYEATKPQGQSSSKIYFPAITDYLNADVLDFAFIQQGDAADRAFDAHRSDDVAQHLANINAATHVVVFAPDDPDLISWLPSVRSLPAVREAVEANPAFVKIASLAPPLSGGSIEIYARKTNLPTLAPGTGVLGLEGPYPQWNLPQMRWVIGSAATLKLLDTTPGKASLHLDVKSPVADQTITVSIDGRDQGRCTIAIPYKDKGETCTVDVTIEPGDKEITLNFSRIDTSNDLKRALILMGYSLQR